MESEQGQIETIAPLSFRATMKARLCDDDVAISWQSDADGAIVQSWWVECRIYDYLKNKTRKRRSQVEKTLP